LWNIDTVTFANKTIDLPHIPVIQWNGFGNRIAYNEVLKEAWVLAPIANFTGQYVKHSITKVDVVGGEVIEVA